MLWYAVTFCLLAVSWAQDCQVANIQVMQNFDKTRVSGKLHQIVSMFGSFVLFHKILRSLSAWPGSSSLVRGDMVRCGKEGPARLVLTR